MSPIGTIHAERKIPAAAAAPQLFTVEGAAELMSIDKMTVYRLIWGGELTWVNIGQTGKRARIRIRESDLEAYVSARLVSGRAV